MRAPTPNFRSSLLAMTCLAVGIGALSGCATQRERSEHAPQYVERPVDLLYNNARDRLDRRQYEAAVLGFQEVDRQHPYSEWSRRSLLMAAYAQYVQNHYEDAIASAQRFISMYPQNENAPYAYYLIAQCYFEQIVDVGRDQRMTELAMAALNEVVQRFPNSEYARDARLKMDMARDQLAGKEMEIGRFYLSSGQPLAAINRFRRVVDLYQTTTHVPEALHRLVEAYLTLGLKNEATQIGAVLGYNYPGSEWYVASYELLTDSNARPARAPDRTLFERIGLNLPRWGQAPRASAPPVANQPTPTP